MSLTCSYPPPSVLSLVLADQVHRDPASGKFSILGTYSVIQSTHFPCTVGTLHLYAALTEGRGRTPLRLVLTDVDETFAPLAVVPGEWQTRNPIEVVEADIQVQNVVFPRPGEYRMQLFSGDHLLRELRLRVALAPGPGAAPTDRGDQGGRLRR